MNPDLVDRRHSQTCYEVIKKREAATCTQSPDPYYPLQLKVINTLLQFYLLCHQFGVTLTNRRGQNCNLTNLIPWSSSSILIVFFLPIQLYRGGISYLLSHLSFLSSLLVNSSDQTSFNCFIYKLSLTLTDPSVSIRSPTFFENSSRSISYNILHRFLQKIISQKLDSGIFDNRLRSDKTISGNRKA